MIIQEAVPLASLTTFRVGGRARFVIDIERTEDLPEALGFAQSHNLPHVVLGGGSNVLASDEAFDGVVLRMRIPGIEFVEGNGRVTRVQVSAGESWDELVRVVGGRTLWGIENLAGIPGTVGAAPVQNIGAYGTELTETLVLVEGYDMTTGTTFTFLNDECGFGYRESRFKHEPSRIITRVTLELGRNGAPDLAYTDLAKAAATGIPLSTPAEVGDAVRTIRAHKFPDTSVEGTAGSFFKNPLVSEEVYVMLRNRYPELPRYSAKGGVKIPLAYILDKVLGLRGYRKGPVRLFEAQPLVLVADIGASRSDIEALADEVKEKVFLATGIVIEREVRSIE